MNQAVLRWEKPCREAGKVIYQHRHLTFDNSVRDAIWREAAENTVQTNAKKLTGVWKQMSTLRWQSESWCKGDDMEDCTHKQQYEVSYHSKVKVLQQNTWIDDRNSWNSLYELRQSKTISITLYMERGPQISYCNIEDCTHKQQYEASYHSMAKV